MQKKKLKEKDDQIEKLQKTQINAPKEPKDENNKFAVFIAYFVIFILGYYFGLYSASSDENYDGNNANVTNTNIGDF